MAEHRFRKAGVKGSNPFFGFKPVASNSQSLGQWTGALEVVKMLSGKFDDRIKHEF